jgi:Fic family protein
METSPYGERSPGRLMRVGTGAAAYQAFIPAPLPPAIEMDLDLVRALSAADRAIGELAGLGRNMPNPRLFIRPFMTREAVLSSRIEGTQADIEDVYAFEAGHPEHHSDVQEVANYVHALEYGLDRISTLPISLRLMREMHARLMRGVRGEYATPGEFRTSQNWIGRGGDPLSRAVFVPPPPHEMRAALGSLEMYLHAEDQYPPLIRIGLIHYHFEAIHPFVDGNGRIGRLLISLLLVHWGLLPLPLLYLSAYFERNRETYYALLLAVSERGAWKEWLTFFMAGIAEQAQDAIHRARKLQDLQVQWRNQMTAAHASTMLLRLVDTLFESPFLTIPQAAEVLDMTYQGANRNVEKLVSAGILRRLSPNQHHKFFVADRILRVVSETDAAQLNFLE